MTASLGLGILLLIVGLVAAVLEVFVPSGGILAVGSGASLITSVVLAFRINLMLGVVFLLLIIILLPTALLFGVKIFPATPVGRKIMLRRTQKEVVSAGGVDEDLKALDGKTGTTLTRCRPAGMAEIQGQRVNVVAEGTMLEPGIPIKVVRIEGNRVVVHAATDETKGV